MIKHIFSIILISILLAGCSEPVIDATTDKSRRSSISKILDSMSDSEKDEFNTAIKIVMFYNIERSALSPIAQTGGDLDQKIYVALHGKTAEQVISQAEKIKPRHKWPKRSKK